MYYLTILKHEKSEPDSLWRIKVICNKYLNKDNEGGIASSWFCLYGIDNWTSKEPIEARISRKDIIDWQKRKYFVESKEDESLVLKNNLKH